MTTDSFEFRPSSRLEFEHVEIDSLIAKQKAASEVVEDPIDRDALSINFGRDKTHQPAATERMLAGATIDWLLAFPAEARPKMLCDRFPHVANRLAQGWRDVAASTQAVQQLADDARWGSVGFPAQVQDELKRLLSPRTAPKPLG
jgi:hypothetical protein